MPRSRSLAAFVALVLGATAVVAHADLDAAQTRLLDEAAKALDVGETNRTVVEGGLPAGAVSASQARLARSRLGAVKSALEQADARLARLPKGEATVEPVRARAAALAAAVAAIEARLDESAPAAPSGGGAKLDHRQREALKNAEFHVREVVGKAASIAELVADVGTKHPMHVDRRTYADALATLRSARVKATYASEQLGPLPKDVPDVAAVETTLEQGVASLAASEKVLAPLYEQLLLQLDPAKRPAHRADRQRLAGFAAAFHDEQLFGADPRRAAKTMKLLPLARAERARILREYELWILQATDEGRSIEGAAEHAKDAMDAFETAAKVQRSFLPGEVDQALERLNALVEQAVAEHKPALFGGGIPQAVDELETALALLVVLDPEAATARTTALDALRATIVATRASLRDAIVAANEPAPDRYRGDDRADLERRAVAAWKEVVPSAEVLRIVIPSESWTRQNLLRLRSSEWVLEDTSRLQVQLLVRFDATTLVVRPVDLVKDHAAGDRIEAYPMDAVGDDLPPSRYVLAEKVR